VINLSGAMVWIVATPSFLPVQMIGVTTIHLSVRIGPLEPVGHPGRVNPPNRRLNSGTLGRVADRRLYFSGDSIA
jgi:hypothetical protein